MSSTNFSDNIKDNTDNFKNNFNDFPCVDI